MSNLKPKLSYTYFGFKIRHLGFPTSLILHGAIKLAELGKMAFAIEILFYHVCKQRQFYFFCGSAVMVAMSRIQLKIVDRFIVGGSTVNMLSLDLSYSRAAEFI